MGVVALLVVHHALARACHPAGTRNPVSALHYATIGTRRVAHFLLKSGKKTRFVAALLSLPRGV